MRATPGIMEDRALIPGADSCCWPVQVQSVPILTGQGGAPPDLQKVWRQQMKWVLLWLILSLLTCLHSGALMLATQYNIFATVRLPTEGRSGTDVRSCLILTEDYSSLLAVMVGIVETAGRGCSATVLHCCLEKHWQEAAGRGLRCGCNMRLLATSVKKLLAEHCSVAIAWRCLTWHTPV